MTPPAAGSAPGASAGGEVAACATQHAGGRHAVVAGGAGFLGAHLCRRLSQAHYRVTCIDNFSTGRVSNIAALRDSPNFRDIRHDVTLPITIEADILFNLACPASPVHYQADPVQTMRTSVWGMYHLLEVARTNKARIVHASTSEVYGDPRVHPQVEDDWGHVNPIGVRACYDEGKRAAEALCFDYRRQHHVDVRVARIFNTYGPGMDPDDGRVVSNFITQALRNAPLTLYGDGTQTRSLCYVDDLIEALVAMAEGPALDAPVNLGNPAEITMRQLAQEVLAATGSASELAHRPLPPDDPQRRRPDISRARQLYGWEPRVPLREGIARCLPHFRTEP